jgi:hypothetical protein
MITPPWAQIAAVKEIRARISASRLRAVTGTSQALSDSHSSKLTWRGVA